MSDRVKRWLMLALLTAGGTVLFQGNWAACTRFTADWTATSANWCFVFDCQNGIYGGLIDPCAGSNPLLVDCPATTATP